MQQISTVAQYDKGQISEPEFVLSVYIFTEFEGNQMNTIKQFLDELESKAPPSGAINILKADHKKVDMMFKQFEKVEKNTDKQLLLDAIVKELSIHATIEEQLVYPLIDKMDHEGTGEALEEHHVVKLILAELADMKASDEKTESKVKVLSEIVKHHVKEEETELLVELKESGADLEELGEKILARKEKLEIGIEKIGDKSGKQIGGSPEKASPSQRTNGTRKAS